MGVTGGNIHTILLQEENIINVPPTIGFEQWFDMSDWKKKKAEGDQAYNEWFKAKMDDVIRRLRDPEHVEKYGQITELRKKLNVQYAVGRQQKLLNEHYTGRKWLGEKIDAWLEDPNAPRRCLVTGVPGVGKSAFAVHYAHYNPKTAAALFFSADMPNYNDPCVVIQTLAYLLACRLSAYRKSLLWELNQEDRTTLAKLTEKELLDKLITRPLSQAINGNHPAMCIILDGLEECGDPQKNTLAKTIARYADSLPWWLHILIVARDVPAVKNYTKNALRIEMHGEDKDNLEDIRAYYREALEEKFGNTGHFQVLLAVPFAELSKTCTGFVSLLRNLTRFQKIRNNLLRMRSNRHCPNFKVIRIVSHVFLVSFRHMLQLHQRIVLHRLQAAVTRHTTAVVVDLDNILRYANINFLSNQIVRNRVFVPTIRDAVIVGNLSHRPDGRLKRNCWQRQHDSQTFHIIVSGETGELLCKYDES